ncbi:MAG: hypothetical protein FWE88_00920 [Phycisphaerae bacterium]|nr:hypothetical protein [Phycisphaerae bacterium]
MKRSSIAVALVVTVACSSSFHALERRNPDNDPPTVSIVSPKAGTIKGPVAMEAKLDGELPEGGGVQFVLDGAPLCGPIMQPPFTFAWHTAYVWDTDAVLEAVVVNGKGETVATSKPVAMRIDNGFGGRVTVSGADLSKPLTGVVKLKLHAERTMTDADREANQAAGQHPDKAIESIMVFIDGVQHTHKFGAAEIEVELDTARLPNGPHELFVQVAAFKKDVPTCAMLRRMFVTENEPPLPYLEPRFNRVYLAPGESINLNPVAVFNDKGGNVMSSCGPIADTAVATIDDKRDVTAVAPGVTTLTITGPFLDGSTEKKITIIVDKPHGFAHFGRDGSILTEYDPKKSLWVRTMFTLEPHEIDRTPGLPEAVRAAGLNVLSGGLYNNPADGGAKSFDEWFPGWKSRWDAQLALSEKLDMPMLLHGDDVARTRNEMNGSINLEWGPKAVQAAFQAAADSKRVVGIEMIDEVSFLWGDTPVPTDGRWDRGEFPFKDDAFLRLMKTINGVKGRPGITWPIGGISSHQASSAWMGDPRFSDYATLFWDILAWRRAYNTGGSHPQELDALRRCVDDRLYGLQRDKPMLLLASGCGPFYKKRGEGSQYVPGQDLSLCPPGQPATPTNSTILMYAPAAGMAGVRVYSFDYQGWRDERRMNKPGSEAELQTGAHPFEAGTDRWLSMAAAFRLIENLEPYMLLPQTHAPYLGEGIFTGARKGKDGEMVIAINMTNGVRTIDNLPFPSADATDDVTVDAEDRVISRMGIRASATYVVHRVHGMTLRADKYTGGPLTLKPGEAVVRIAPMKDGKRHFIKGVTCAFASPLTDAHVRGKVNVVVAAASNTLVEDVKVDIFVGGVALEGVKKTECGFEAVWDASKAKPGVWHGLSAVATDKDGNKTEARTAIFVREPSEKQPEKE